ncbi:MAG: TldD/PmbA family protein [Theionarchaea archaeon]|nr:TldD/PmbA family protein [Theionarchaea archaeon]
MSDILSTAQKSSASFALVRRHKREYLQIGIKEGKITQMSSSLVDGLGVRCLIEGSWGFACSTDVQEGDRLVEKAVKAAGTSAAQKRRKCDLAFSPAVKGTWESPVNHPVTYEAVEDIIGYIREADACAAEYPEIISKQISFLSTCDKKEIATSEGAFVNQREYRVFCTAAVTAKVAGRRATANNAVGGQYGTEFFRKDDLRKMVKKECERALRLATAQMPPAGRTKVVLTPDVASVLVHEAVGHTAEADVVLGGSYLSGKRGEKVGNECITLIDDGTYAHGFGSYGFDDEGVQSQKTYIIEKGILNHYLHVRETALNSPTGNGRAWLYSREPLIRMTNTYLEPQDYTFEELIQEVKDGLLLKGITSGLADHFGNFTLHVLEAQKIAHGSLSDVYYSGVTVSANAFDLLAHMSAVGDTSTFKVVPGVCGKGETAFVGMGAPALVTAMVVGGEV